MKRIDIKLSLPIVAPLLDLLKEEAEVLRGTLASPVQVADLDSEMREIWQEGLLLDQAIEVDALLRIFDEEFFATGTVRIDQAHADVIIRASAALRLQLRKVRLKLISDETLENGQVDPDVMTENQRKGFFCYVFLATLQELVIQHLEGSMP
jgi:hypothetical protein